MKFEICTAFLFRWLASLKISYMANVRTTVSCIFAVPRGTRIILYCDSGKRVEKSLKLTASDIPASHSSYQRILVFFFVFALYVLLSNPRSTHQPTELPPCDLPIQLPTQHSVCVSCFVHSYQFIVHLQEPQVHCLEIPPTDITY